MEVLRGPCDAMDKIWAGHGKVSLSGSKGFDWQIHLTASQPWSQHQFGVISLVPSKDVQPQRMKFYKRGFALGPWNLSIALSLHNCF